MILELFRNNTEREIPCFCTFGEIGENLILIQCRSFQPVELFEIGMHSRQRQRIFMMAQDRLGRLGGLPKISGWKTGLRRKDEYLAIIRQFSFPVAAASGLSNGIHA